MTDATPTEMTVTDKAGRVIVIKVLDPAETLDLFESAGAASTNEGYMRYAMMVRSVASIDGLPVPKVLTQDGLRMAAKLLGNDGVAAVGRALFGVDSQANAAGEVETAKN